MANRGGTGGYTFSARHCAQRRQTPAARPPRNWAQCQHCEKWRRVVVLLGEDDRFRFAAWKSNSRAQCPFIRENLSEANEPTPVRAETDPRGPGVSTALRRRKFSRPTRRTSHQRRRTRRSRRPRMLPRNEIPGLLSGRRRSSPSNCPPNQPAPLRASRTRPTRRRRCKTGTRRSPHRSRDSAPPAVDGTLMRRSPRNPRETLLLNRQRELTRLPPAIKTEAARRARWVAFAMGKQP